MRCWRVCLSVMRCKRFVYGPADATAIPSSLALLKSRQTGLTLLVLAYPGCRGKEAVKLVSETRVEYSTCSVRSVLPSVL